MSLGTDRVAEGCQALKSSILGFQSQLIVVIYFVLLAITVSFVSKGRESSLEGLLERLNM